MSEFSHPGTSLIGVGARTPVGVRGIASAAAVRAGVSRLSFHPVWRDRSGEKARVALDLLLPWETPVTSRMREMAVWALDDACTSLAGFAGQRASLFVALPEPRPAWSAADADALMAALTEALARRVPVAGSGSIHFLRGHAAGALALEAAAEALQHGACSLALVGGVDSYMSPDTIDWLDEAGQLAHEVNRLGFTPGEAAGFLLLALPHTARALGARELARVLAIGVGNEPNRIKTDTVCVGEGLAEVVRSAARPLQPPEQKISAMYCDINGERYRSEEFMYVPLRYSAPFVDANFYEAPAVSWGDVGAASIPLFAILAAASGLRGYARGTYALIWASSEDGTRGAATLELVRR